MEKTDYGTTWQEVLEKRTGRTIQQLMSEYHCDIPEMLDVKQIVLSHIKNGSHITIVGDYDVDGIFATAILFMTFRKAGADVSYRIPKRFSEGYGLSSKIIDEIRDGLIVTVDNGITAVEQIDLAIEKGLDVVVIDHHLAREDGKIPNAKIVIDPHVTTHCDFKDFCGAGLAYRLAEVFYPDEESFLNCMSSLAAIATVADVMPLLDDNRTIVKKGLDVMINKPTLPALRAILLEFGLHKCSSENVAYKIAPLINAPGRMLDNGGSLVVDYILTPSFALAKKRLGYLVTLNEERKLATENGTAIATQIIKDGCMYGDSVLTLYSPDFFEGVVGIIAGRIAESMGRPCICMTDSVTEPGTIKGSARSVDGINIKQILDQNKRFLRGYGGHAMAAGLSVDSLDNLSAFSIACCESATLSQKSNNLKYDLEVTLEQVPSLIEELERMEPYGEGCPKPLFKLDIHSLPVVASTSYYQKMNGDGLKFLCKCGVSALMFRQTKEYEESGAPRDMTVVGTISNNYFYSGGKTTVTPQIMIEGFEKLVVEPKMTPLAKLLADKAKRR